MEPLKKKRAAIKRQLSFFQNYVKKIEVKVAQATTVDPKLVVELKKRVAKVEPLLDEFNEVQLDIETITDDPAIVALAEAESFQDTYFETVSLAESLLSNKQKPNIEVEVDNLDAMSVHSHASATSNAGSAGSNSNTNVKNAGCNFVKLPTISLPKFEGKSENWLEFRDTFASLIHGNDAITEIQKFHYLRGSLQGKAAEIIKSLEFSAENYEIAWSALCERYTRVLVHNHIKALFGLDIINKESSEKIRALIDFVWKHLRSLSSLAPTETFWEILIIFLVTSKLDPITAREWEQTQVTDGLPTLSEVKEFLKRKADILETLESKGSITHKSYNDSKKAHDIHKTSRSFLSNTTSTVCSFCNNSDHDISTCEEFLKLSVQERLSKVKDKKLCINCLRKGHFILNCRAKSCRLCKRRHHTLLHNNALISQNERRGPEPVVEQCNQSSGLKLWSPRFTLTLKMSFCLQHLY